MKFAIKTVAASVLLMSASAVFAQQGQTVKIAWLDPLSGLMAAVGTNQLKSFQFLAEEFNKKNPAGVKFEIIGIDNKLLLLGLHLHVQTPLLHLQLSLHLL